MTMIGIDPHKATHTAVAVDRDEQVIGEFTLEASGCQVRQFTDWADRFTKREWAVESANGLGYLIARQLVAAGETVFDVPPVLVARVRVLGSGKSQKNDPNDARSIAIAALRSDRLATVRPDDHVTVLRLLVKRHRDMARLRNKHCSPVGQPVSFAGVWLERGENTIDPNQECPSRFHRQRERHCHDDDWDRSTQGIPHGGRCRQR